eukprot:1618048-Rhodomonas_salina.2
MFEFALHAHLFPHSNLTRTSSRWQIILGSAERFDVRVTLPPSRFKVGDVLAIRAETLENRAQV